MLADTHTRRWTYDLYQQYENLELTLMEKEKSEHNGHWKKTITKISSTKIIPVRSPSAAGEHSRQLLRVSDNKIYDDQDIVSVRNIWNSY